MMDPRRVTRLLGDVALARGRSNEQRVLEACMLPTRPAWMLAARRATATEDRAGIDVVIESDVGKLYVQVKSSREGKAAFLEKRPRAHAAVVVVRRDDGPEALLRKVAGELSKARAAYRRERDGR